MLDHLRREHRPMSLAELATAVTLGKPSTLRLLRTLEALGYISRDGNKNYRVQIEGAGGVAPENLHLLRRAAKRHCQQLRSKCGETVTLACLFEDHVRVVDVAESPHQIKMTNFVGRILQPYASSLGKAITAFQDDALIQKVLDVYGVYRVTKNTLTDQLAIQNELAIVRERGYAEDKEETVEGGYCFGVPVYGPDEAVIAAISISFPRFRVQPSQMERFPSMLQEAAAAVTAAFEGEVRKNFARAGKIDE